MLLQVPEQRFPCSPGENHAGADTHSAVLRRTPCQSRRILPEGPATHGGPRLEEIFPKGLQPGGGLTLEQGKGTRKEQQRNCYVPTADRSLPALPGEVAGKERGRA